MKKRFKILAVAGVILATVLLVVFLSDAPAPTIRFVFLGYTNTGAQAEALFSVRLPPDFGGCGWRDPEVSRKEGAVWQAWSSTNQAKPKMRYFTEPPPPGPERMAVGYAAFPVETTNDVSRIIIEVDENPRKSVGTTLANILWGWLGKGPVQQNRRSYFLTNETSFKPAD